MATLLAVTPLAWSAADPVRGATLYSSNCTSCHGAASAPTNPLVLNARNASSVLRNAISTNRGGMGFLSGLSEADAADIAAFLGNSPGSVSFAGTAVGSSSAAQSVTVRASSALALSTLAATVSGDFQRSGGSCGSSLAAGGSCTIDLQFVPGATGSRSGALNLVHNGLAAGVQIGLSGSGTAAAAPLLSVNAASLSFGDLVLASTSATQSITVKNSGDAALSFSSLALAGAAAADYRLSGNCAVGSPLAAGGECSVGVAFSPSALGARAATLNIASNGGNGSVSLAGQGVAQPLPAVSFAETRIDFGNQTLGSSATARSLALTNSGNAGLSLVSLQVSGPFSLIGHDCGASLAAKASCTLQIGFTPAGIGAASGTLSLVSNAAGSPHTVALAGAGVAAAPQLAWSPAVSSLAFGSGTVGAALTAQTLTLSNQGPGSATLTELRLSGAAAADFHLEGQGSCSAGTVLPAGGTCTAVLGFVPGAVGPRSASLDVVSNGNVPGSVALGGTGVAAPAPVLTLSSRSLSFVREGSTGSNPSQTLTLANGGNATLRISALTLLSANFGITAGGSGACAAAPFELAAGQQCVLTLNWSGNGSSEQASLVIASNAGAAGETITLSASQQASVSNQGGGGCTLGEGTASRDPVLLGMALAAAALLWRRRRAAPSAGAASQGGR
ncbi:choice-of-anchor D domain-containing protein [Aquabacterium sp.]|uniref:choice-of-anchor D domain-containing protein n=1 Tax=Aquabacterium sp. TaxID=1872578 RepID=UPI002CF8B385|nr:choice-of-anchor D domain-containing protein [Aquabacterium sp.]HSW04328.1 choice-of-anchor D domain-containing protein [Aquabacterium sp.]